MSALRCGACGQHVSLSDAHAGVECQPCGLRYAFGQAKQVLDNTRECLRLDAGQAVPLKSRGERVVEAIIKAANKAATRGRRVNVVRVSPEDYDDVVTHINKGPSPFPSHIMRMALPMGEASVEKEIHRPRGSVVVLCDIESAEVAGP